MKRRNIISEVSSFYPVVTPVVSRFNRYVLTMSHEAIDEAYKAYDQCADEWEKIAEERNALQPIDRNYVGFAGVQKRQEELAEFTRREEAASEAARAKVKKAREKFFVHVEAQIFATEKKHNECKSALDILDNEFISSPDELTKLAETWQDNSIMRTAMRKYAKEHEWQGFDFMDSNESVREFGKAFFELADKACGAPLGYEGFWMNGRHDVKACIDLAKAYEVIAEYQKGYDKDY